MKVIVTKDPTEIPVSIATKVDGRCLHNGELVKEMVDCGHANSHIGDWVDDIHEFYVCNSCGDVLDLVRDDEAFRWFGQLITTNEFLRT